MKPEFEYTISGNRWAYRPQHELTAEQKAERNERFEKLLSEVEAACNETD